VRGLQKILTKNEKEFDNIKLKMAMDWE